jgi:hypothetical protein
LLLGRVGATFIERRLSLLILFIIFYTDYVPSLKISEHEACFPNFLNLIFCLSFRLIPYVWPVTINGILAAPSHTPKWVSDRSNGYVCPFLDQHGSKLLDGSGLQLTSWNSDLQLIPHVFYWIKARWANWPVHALKRLTF